MDKTPPILSASPRLLQFGFLCAVVSALLSGFSNSFYAAAARSFQPLPYAFAASLFSGLALIIMARSRGPFPAFSVLRREQASLFRLVLIRGFLCTIVFALAIQHTSASKLVVLTKMEPYLVIFWAWLLLREKVRRAELYLLAVHVCGAVLVSIGSSLSFRAITFGDFFILLALLLSSLSYTDAKKASLSIGPLWANAISNLGALVFLLPLLLIFPVAPGASESWSWWDLAMSIILFQLIGVPLWLASLATVKGWQVSAVRALSPLTGIPFAAYYLGEKFDYIQLIGAFIVILTSALIGRIHFKKS